MSSRAKWVKANSTVSMWKFHIVYFRGGFHGESHESRSNKTGTSLGVAVDKNLAVSAGDEGSITGPGRSHMLLGH